MSAALSSINKGQTMQTKTFDYRGYFVMYERQAHNGALTVDAVHHETDKRIKRQFYGYTVAQAKQAIKQAITEAKG
jgi:ketosteroid isomerase-like protein